MGEARPWWKRRLVALALTLVLMLLMAASMLLPAYGVPIAGAFARSLGLGPLFVLAWQIGQWPLILVLLLLAFELLYHFAPHRPNARWEWVVPAP